MLPEEAAVIRADDRVTRLFSARTRDRGDQTVESPLPSNDIGPVAAPFADLVCRLDDALEQRMREPFSRIRTIMAVLRHEPGGRHIEQLGSIGEAARQAEGMLSDLLDFMRCAAGGLGVRRRRLDLKVLCERVIDAIHANHPDRAMLFTSDARVEGEWDPDHMAMLLVKLVLNALDHGPLRPAIRVELHGLPNEAILCVWNAGAVQDSVPLHRLFEPFVYGRSNRQNASEGLGLGLFLAREVARAHGGRIDVQSTEADGTTFRATVPRS
jgi:signal transduction histidine kinase